MIKRLIILLSIALLLVLPATAKEEERLKIGDPAPKFTLKDADDKEHSLEKLLRKDEENARIVILIMGDRKVRKDTNQWAKKLHELYKEKKEEIALLMLADLRDLPFFATKSMVKWGTKREKLPVTIVLDWEGKINKLYKTQKGKSDIFIVNSDGKIAYHQVSKYTDDAVKKIQGRIQDLFKQKQLEEDEDENR